MTNFSTMTDDQLDEWLATSVMGWTKHAEPHSPYYMDTAGVFVIWTKDWQPTSNLNQAVMCADFMANLGFSWTVENVENDHYHACVLRPSSRTMFDCDTADNPARALCEAIAMAVEGEK